MPDTMPKDLRERIKYDSANNNTKDLQTIWLTCEGKYPVDVENIGPIDYYPFRGFTGFSYPCTNKDECTEPLVAINFERPHSKFEFESITFTGYGITVMLTLLYGPSAYALKGPGVDETTIILSSKILLSSWSFVHGSMYSSCTQL